MDNGTFISLISGKVYRVSAISNYNIGYPHYNIDTKKTILLEWCTYKEAEDCLKKLRPILHILEKYIEGEWHIIWSPTFS